MIILLIVLVALALAVGAAGGLAYGRRPRRPTPPMGAKRNSSVRPTLEGLHAENQRVRAELIELKKKL